MVDEAFRRRIEQTFGEVNRLPTLPDVAVKLTQMVNDSGTSMRQIESVIEVDPVLSSTVLKVVNSSFYGMAQEISSLRLALVILGIKEIRNLVLSLSVFQLFDNNSSSSLDLHEFWHHSAATGQISKTLAQHFNLHFAGEEFVGGLIHDIGKMVLINQLEDEYLSLYDHAKENAVPLWSLEMKEFGFHHGHVGGWLAARWHLPKKLCAAITYHHAPADSREHFQLVGVVALANALMEAHQMEDIQAFSFEEHPAVNLLVEHTIGMESVDWTDFPVNIDSEIAKSLEFISLSQEGFVQTA